MATLYQYILDLKDNVSASMQRIADNATRTIERLKASWEMAKATWEATAKLAKDLGKTGVKMNIPKTPVQPLLSPENIILADQAAKKIGLLQQQVTKLDSAVKGKKLVGYLDSVNRRLEKTTKLMEATGSASAKLDLSPAEKSPAKSKAASRKAPAEAAEPVTLPAKAPKAPKQPRLKQAQPMPEAQPAQDKPGILANLASKAAGKIKSLPGPGTIAEKGVRSAMQFEESMAKVNLVARLDEKGLSGLKDRLQKIAVENKADITLMPEGFENIISQTGSVDTSLKILEASLKGSKAGFTDLNTVSDSLVKTLGAMGGQQASADELLDTFFAAQKAGAGGFKEMGTFLPNLIAGAGTLGMDYKSVAGVFAYMTGKQKDAGQASAMMEQMFSALGKSDITANLGKAGIQIFDTQGKMRDMASICNDLNGAMTGLNDGQKTAFLDQMGIKGAEAQSAFLTLSQDTEGLSKAMETTANSAGSTASALEASATPLQKSSEIWNQLNSLGFMLGQTVLPAISFGLDLVSGVLGGVTSLFMGWGDSLREGDPLVWGITAALAALGVALIAYELATNKAKVATQLKSVWDSISTGYAYAMAAAMWMFNTSLLGCPIVWIILAIGALVGAIVLAWNKFEGFRQVVMGVWEVIKAFGQLIWDSIVGSIRSTMEGLGALGRAIGKLFKGEFGAAAEEAKTGVQKLFEANPITATVKAVQKSDIGGAWEKGKQKGAESWARSQDEKKAKEGAAGNGIIPQPGQSIQMPETVKFPGLSETTGLQNKVPGQSKQPGVKLPAPPAIGAGQGMQMPGATDRKGGQDIRESSAYAAIMGGRGGGSGAPVALTTATATALSTGGNPALGGAAATGTPQARTQATADTEAKNNWLPGIASELQRLTSFAATIVATLGTIAAIQTKTVNPQTQNSTGVSTAITAMPDVPPLPAMNRETEITNEFGGGNGFQGGGGSRSLQMEKYCEQVVINIQNTDQRGTAEIEQIIQQTLTHIFDNYEA